MCNVSVKINLEKSHDCFNHCVMICQNHFLTGHIAYHNVTRIVKFPHSACSCSRRKNACSTGPNKRENKYCHPHTEIEREKERKSTVTVKHTNCKYCIVFSKPRSDLLREPSTMWIMAGYAIHNVAFASWRKTRRTEKRLSWTTWTTAAFHRTAQTRPGQETGVFTPRTDSHHRAMVPYPWRKTLSLAYLHGISGPSFYTHGKPSYHIHFYTPKQIFSPLDSGSATA